MAAAGYVCISLKSASLVGLSSVLEYTAGLISRRCVYVDVMWFPVCPDTNSVDCGGRCDIEEGLTRTVVYES